MPEECWIDVSIGMQAYVEQNSHGGLRITGSLESYGRLDGFQAGAKLGSLTSYDGGR
jgi:hypothetical protein